MNHASIYCEALSRQSQQLGHVAVVEAVEGLGGAIVHRRFKLPNRVRRAFGMGVVGREDEQLWADIVDDPSNRLSGEWRELQVRTYDFRWAAIELSDALQRVRRKVETAQP